MALFNDPHAVEGLTIRSTQILGEMNVSNEERDKLCKMIAEVFTGHAGGSSDELQNRIKTKVAEYNTALESLKNRISTVNGVDGEFTWIDKAQASRFMGIG
ncbi:hypothetical protein [Nocardia amamiensis]|uniref:hypothetical protein n=1 Tax=Nocardia amamiensis TaxID=404578 RepID=UPI00082F4610|nr:hypothetical protein [Nocardia amamiensis]